MNARWHALANRFAALKQRERMMVAAALAVLVVFAGYTFWVEPGRLQANSLERQITQNRNEISATEALVAGLKSKLTDPDAQNRKALAEARNELAAVDQELKQYDGILTSPTRVPDLLQSLLRHHRGLTLLSLQSIPPVPLLPPGEKKDDKPAPVAGGNIFKHGIEIKVGGSYPDLLGYVNDLEHAPQKLLWGKMELTAATYPHCELTLTVYTLSLDSRWLVL